MLKVKYQKIFIYVMRKSGHVLLFRYSFHPVGIQCEDKLDNKLQAYIKLVIFINSFHTLDIQ